MLLLFTHSLHERNNFELRIQDANMPAPNHDERYHNKSQNDAEMSPLQDGLVCKPTDGRRRISFATADDYAYERPQQGVRGSIADLALNDIDEEIDIAPTKKKKSSSSRRKSVDDILAESELDQVYGEVFMTPAERKKSMIDVSLSPRRSHLSSHVSELPTNPRRHPFWERCEVIVFVIAIIALLGTLAYGGINLNEETIVNNEKVDTSIQSGELIGPVDLEDSDFTGEVPQETPWGNTGTGNNDDAKAELTKNPPRADPAVAPAESAPGDDIAQLLLGNVKQPVQAEEVQELLDDDMLKGIRVIDPDGKLDLTAETIVTVDNSIEIRCGVIMDNVSLTLICENDSCGVYFVGAHYCDAYSG